MSSESIVEFSNSKLCLQRAAFSRSNLPVMQTNLFGKCPRFPALHSRCDDGNMIYASRLYRHVSANVLKTGTAEKLARTGNMLDAHKASRTSNCPGTALP